MRSIGSFNKPKKVWLIYPLNVFTEKTVKKELMLLQIAYPEMGYKCAQFILKKVKDGEVKGK